MIEIEFLRWLTSVGIFDQRTPYHSTCDPIRGFWGYEEDCRGRTVMLYDRSFNEVYRFMVDKHFNERVEEYRKEVSKIFEL
jgi:hypothetical protein